MDLEALSLTSATGVVAATMMLIQLLKRVAGKNESFNRVPVWLYAVIIAAGLALLANKVLTTPDGTPLLPGNALSVLWKSVILAASASGFYTYFANPEQLKTAAEPSITQPQLKENDAKTVINPFDPNNIHSD